MIDHLKEIFKAGLNRVDPHRMIIDHVRLSGSRLLVSMETQHLEVDLDAFRQVFVIGAGKAAARMAKAFEQILGNRIHQGVIVVKYKHTEPLDIIETLEAGHPVPDENGVAAAKAILALADKADTETLVITLISGGGSALLPMPLQCQGAGFRVDLGLEDKQQTTTALLSCGADIEEINCLRKHLSGVKGGRLLQHLAPARSLNFILSDVVGDDLSSIASGLTTIDPTTFDDALAIIDKYGISKKVPESVLETLRLGKEGMIAETLKKGAEAVLRASNILIGTNRTAIMAAGEKARQLGYNTALLTSRITGEAREIAKFIGGVALDVKASDMIAKKPACVISGGEPVVTLRGCGKGGRNQEMALALLAEMERRPSEYRGIHFLAAATDGNDGPTDAAGAFACSGLVGRAKIRNVSISGHLRNNDSYHFFEKTGGLYKTGPTNTNVCDLHILLVCSDENAK
jgi:hydroxypyruvate reductase